MTTDKLATMRRNNKELQQALDDMRRIRTLIDRARFRHTMTHSERLAWEVEVAAILKGTGIALAEEPRR